jgi:Uma2 family endonuclease
MPGLKKAELIEGVVHMPSPVRHRGHGRLHSHIMTWLGYYAVNTTGVDSCDNGSVRLDLDNEPQPDAFLIIQSECEGQTLISDDDYIEGAPELIAEVSSSSVSYDLGDKLKVYRRNEVREYIVWRVLDRKIDWFVLRDERFEPMAPGPDGILRSEVFPGLWLDPAALIRGDLPAVFDALRQGLASDAHEKFVRKLERARAK